MHHRNRTPLRVPIMAILAALFAALLFGGVTHAADETQSSSGITTEAQSVNTTAQSSGAVTTTAATGNEQPTSCNPRNISPEEIQTDFKTQDGSGELTAYEAVEFSVNLTLEEGHCAGDQAVVSVPNEFGTDGDNNPVPMTTPSGVVIGIATYDGPTHTVTVRLTDQVEVPGRKDFYATAWWRVYMTDDLIPGETRELRWNVDGIIRRTTVKVGTCDGCSQIGADPSKWGFINDNVQSVTVVLPTATQDAQTFVVTDVLTSPGQRFDCGNLIAGRVGVYTSANDWGAPQYSRFQEPDITSCDNSKATINVRLNKGEKARVQLNVLVDSTDPGPWTDTASITSQDQSWEVSARVARRESGGGAGFTPTPTPSPAPTPAPSTSPTPAPSVTPSATPTPVPTPSASPSPTPTPSPSTSTPVTPTPAPSASPSPSPSAPSPSVTPTPSPSTTPSATPVPTPVTTPSTAPSTVPVPTPTPTPSTPPRQFRLPVTGGAGSGAIASAVALLVIGIGAFWARRRQTAHSED